MGKHDNAKIANIIQAWENNENLSPIFLIKHGRENLGLVADGKHRLTLCAVIAAQEVYFMVSYNDVIWVEQASPCATRSE